MPGSTWMPVGAVAVLALLVALPEPSPPQAATDAASLQRGRYVLRISGCNDCHTPGYAQAGGMVVEDKWLTGDTLGWRGPWGTTYASNLRLYMKSVSEDEWVRIARKASFRPPMPWFALREMTDQDLRAIHRFVRHLGPAGEPAPSYRPPGQDAPGPLVRFPY